MKKRAVYIIMASALIFSSGAALYADVRRRAQEKTITGRASQELLVSFKQGTLYSAAEQAANEVSGTLEEYDHDLNTAVIYIHDANQVSASISSLRHLSDIVSVEQNGYFLQEFGQ